MNWKSERLNLKVKRTLGEFSKVVPSLREHTHKKKHLKYGHCLEGGGGGGSGLAQIAWSTFFFNLGISQKRGGGL